MTTTAVPLIHYIPFGTTEPQDFALSNDGEPFDGTGFDIDLELHEKVADIMTPVGTYILPVVAWLNQAAGTVRVTDVDALSVGNYYVRFQVTDSGGKIGYFPNGKKADIWVVAAIGGV